MTGIEHMVAQMSGTLPLPACPAAIEPRVSLTRPSVFERGAAIEELRAEGLTTRQIAERLGVSRKSVSAWESQWRKVQ
ncbi:helix-turn-helix domain-containing protein [Candidimonas nitroreducens]|uniref:Uncharacterized protein n=1 Tax=Candidimonas nitroreducens TaxID=683354 RepID=A0A225MR92_9BURK|nr:helix-turn-helix domain-containing protein [Candidimonas nitroreducens]OWT61991.1 hypothetical protein CEY11_09275 [Candidimonas nitroreducens]